jgi:hypothetical protein
VPGDEPHEEPHEEPREEVAVGVEVGQPAEARLVAATEKPRMRKTRQVSRPRSSKDPEGGREKTQGNRCSSCKPTASTER